MEEQQVKVTPSSGNVFRDLGFDDADERLEKSKLVAAIGRAIREEGLTQAQAAKRLGIDQPQVSKMLRGLYDRYSIDRLCRFLNAFGHDVTVTIGPRTSAEGRMSVALAEEPRSYD